MDEAIEINKFPFKIGRKTKNSHRDLFSHNDLYLKDEAPFNISRNHLSIQYYRDKFLVRDRGSTLGTIVNDERIGGPVNKREMELLKNRENTIIVGSHKSPYVFKVRVP